MCHVASNMCIVASRELYKNSTEDIMILRQRSAAFNSTAIVCVWKMCGKEGEEKKKKRKERKLPLVGWRTSSHDGQYPLDGHLEDEYAPPQTMEIDRRGELDLKIVGSLEVLLGLTLMKCRSRNKNRFYVC